MKTQVLIDKAKTFMKQTWLDCYLAKFKFYRMAKGCIWYLHEFTIHAEQLTFSKGNKFWARYETINKYSEVIEQEIW